MPRHVVRERSRVVYRQHGPPVYRRVYPGYEHGFPPPAMLYYGYPHSGSSFGMGFMGF
jgi:hypothetical protein